MREVVRRLDQKLQKFSSKDSNTKKYQEVFVKGEYEFPCANGTPRLPYPPRPSSTAEGNLEPEDDAEIEEGDKKER